jgi:hypothetical protein
MPTVASIQRHPVGVARAAGLVQAVGIWAVLALHTVASVAADEPGPGGEAGKAVELGAVVRASMDDLVARLGAAEHAVRERASAELHARGEGTLREIEAALRRADLSQEQRVRLRTAARELFLRTPRGALGVEFNTQFGGVPNLIRRVLPNFPAAASLQPGDQILSIDGVRTDSTDEFGRSRGVRPMVISRDPGDVVKVLVRRSGREVEVPVRLGRFDELANALAISAPDFAEAWAMRTRTWTVGTAEPVTAELPSDPELPVMPRTRWDMEQNPRFARPLGAQRLNVAVGGQPAHGRPGLSSSVGDDVWISDPMVRVAGPGVVQGQVIIQQGGQVIIRDFGGPAVPPGMQGLPPMPGAGGGRVEGGPGEPSLVPISLAPESILSAQRDELIRERNQLQVEMATIKRGLEGLAGTEREARAITERIMRMAADAGELDQRIGRLSQIIEALRRNLPITP